MDSDFNKIFKIPIRALKLTRTHPDIPRDKKWALYFFIVHGLFTLIFINIFYNIFYYNLKANNFSQTCKNGVLSVVYIVVTFQYMILVLHQNSLVDLIKNINRDYEQSKNLDSEERDVMSKYMNQGIWVCNQWLFLTTCGSTMFPVKNWILFLYYYYIDEFHLVPIYDLVFPAIIEENKDNIFVYLLIYALFLFYDFYGAIMYAAFVPLGPIFMLHACGQLELLRMRINNLFVECDDQVIRRKLKRIVVQLQDIYSFVEQIKQIFKFAYEVTLKGTALLLPITCYEVIEATYRGEVSIEFLTFIIGGTLISSSPCYYSDLLMEKGEDVRLALYTCGWEHYYDRRTRSTLQLMLQHGLRPTGLKTVLQTLCLETLTRVFQQSYAIFNTMNAMWD